MSCLLLNNLKTLFISLAVPFNVIPAALCGELANLTLYLLFAKRIESLGPPVAYESLVWYIPYFMILILMIPTSTYIMTVFDQCYLLGHRWAFVGASIVTLLVEIYLLIILIKKVLFMLEYRPKIQHILITQSVVAFVTVALTEIVNMVLIILKYPNYIVYNLDSIATSTRVLFIIDFYRYLVVDMTRVGDSGIHYEERRISI